MVLGVQRRFAEELGWSLSPPMTFSLDTYLAELERAEQAYKSQFGALAVLTRDRWTLMERFFETVVSKSREIFSAAERDTEAWVKSLLPPIELQVREQRTQLRKRAESISKIRDAQGSLDDRIGELEEALEDAQARLADAETTLGPHHAIGARVPDDLGCQKKLSPRSRGLRVLAGAADLRGTNVAAFPTPATAVRGHHAP